MLTLARFTFSHSNDSEIEEAHLLGGREGQGRHNCAIWYSWCTQCFQFSGRNCLQLLDHLGENISGIRGTLGSAHGCCFCLMLSLPCQGCMLHIQSRDSEPWRVHITADVGNVTQDQGFWIKKCYPSALPAFSDILRLFS